MIYVGRKRPFLSMRASQLGAISSGLIVLTMSIVYASVVHAAASGEQIPVNQEAIVVTLPVFFGCMALMSGFVWKIARWDYHNTKEIDKLRREHGEMMQMIRKMQKRNDHHDERSSRTDQAEQD